MTAAEEVILVERLNKGDSDAYTVLYERYHARLYGFIMRFVKIPEIAEDILQEVFLKLWNVRERIDSKYSLQAYLYKITRNCVFKSVKKHSREKAVIQNIQERSSVNIPGEAALHWKQYEAVLVNAVNQLPGQRKKVFQLCREEGKTYEGVAKELGISKNTVKEHMVLATKYIKTYMSRYADFQLLLSFLLLLEIK